MNEVTISLTMDALLALWKIRDGDDKTASQTILRIAGREQLKPPIPASASAATLPAAKFTYEILGEKRHAKSSIDAYLDVLTTLSTLEPQLPDLLSRAAKANTRNHIARTCSEVYPNRPDLS